MPGLNRQQIARLADQLRGGMQRDQFRIGQAIRKLKNRSLKSDEFQKLLNQTQLQLSESRQIRQTRVAQSPITKLDEDLPIFERRDEITQAMRDHQVVVISGETGSGKSTGRFQNSF